jgi:hypothetical protein
LDANPYFHILFLDGVFVSWLGCLIMADVSAEGMMASRMAED